jgi:hypothetical protein
VIEESDLRYCFIYLVTSRQHSHISVSGSEYCPSDVPKGPAKLRKETKETLVAKVDSSNINRNEHDQAMRDNIHNDEVAYQTRIALPHEWLEVLRSLDVFRPKTFLSEKVICNYLLDCWWSHRFDPHTRPIYLPFTEIHLLSAKVIRGIQTEEISFENGSFNRLYCSVVPTATDKRVCFVLHRNEAHLLHGKTGSLAACNHFFPVLFDYDSHKAYAFGVWNVRGEMKEVKYGQSSRWKSWSGPELWDRIGRELGWAADVGDPDTVTVVVKNWRQVCFHLRCAVGGSDL